MASTRPCLKQTAVCGAETQTQQSGFRGLPLRIRDGGPAFARTALAVMPVVIPCSGLLPPPQPAAASAKNPAATTSVSRVLDTSF